MEVFDVFDFRDAANGRLSGNRFCDGSSEFESSGRRQFSGLLVWSSVRLVARLWVFLSLDERWNAGRQIKYYNEILFEGEYEKSALCFCCVHISSLDELPFSVSHPWISLFSKSFLTCCFDSIYLFFFFFSNPRKGKMKWLFFLLLLLLLFCSWLFLSIWLSCGPGEAVCRFESHLLRYGPGLNLNFNALQMTFSDYEGGGRRENVKCLQISVE